MNALIKLREKENLTNTEQLISDFIVKNYKNIKNLSSKELSEKTNSSPASITRLCKKIGLKGFQELKIKLIEESSTSDHTLFELNNTLEINQNDSINSIIDKLNKISISSLKETKSLQNENMIKKIIDLLSTKKVIDFYGVGASHLVALDANYKFMRIGKLTTAYSLYDQQYIQAKNSNSDHLAFVISYSGETPEIVKLTKILLENSTTIISITKNNKNTIEKLADFPLYVTSRESLSRSAAIYSRISMLNLIDIIYLSYFNNNYDVSLEIIRKNKI